MQLETLSSFEDRHHEQFMEQGYLRLGKLLSPAELAAIQQRIDDIMLGKIRYDNMRFQLDPRYTGGDRTRTVGNEEATLNYRRIDDLEQDPLFLAYIQKPLIRPNHPPLHRGRRFGFSLHVHEQTRRAWD